MTATHRRSRGIEHSRKIKSSPRFHEYQIERKQRLAEPPPTNWTHEENEAAKAKADKRVRRRVLKPDPQAWLKACGFDLSGISRQLREYYVLGYVQALRDIKREREKAERGSYVAAMPRLTKQELATISHAWSRHS